MSEQQSIVTTSPSTWWSTAVASVMQPIKACRARYVPLLMVYFAFGALGLIDVTKTMWVKESLTLSPSQLASISVWLMLPWTVKMVFGELVDTVPILGSQRRSYVFIGAGCMAAGMIILAAGAGQWKWTQAVRLEQMYFVGNMLIVLGSVIQDVVADAMSTEVVERVDAAGQPRSDHVIRAELGMVQVLGRLATSTGVLAVAGLSGWLAAIYGRETVFLIGLIIPALSATGVMLIHAETPERRGIDWRILGGGLIFGIVVSALGISDMPGGEEIVFIISMAVICTMLVLVTRELDHKTRVSILFAAIIIFLFRATPSTGDGYTWFSLDVLKFDEAFLGHLGQTGAVIGLVVMWFMSKQLTEHSVVRTLFWITVLGTLLSLPGVGLVFGLHEWTERVFGFGARTIAIVDAAATSPFAQLSMVPLLTLTAYYAPAGHRATWFALMASFMNLALVAGQLQTKHLNDLYPIARGEYGELGALVIVVTVIGLVVPLGAIALFKRRV
jgi:hypothetical protein